MGGIVLALAKIAAPAALYTGKVVVGVFFFSSNRESGRQIR
jgi:Pyruvate/2-oxoacid:ferredoxin oxidoreductase gamma subunit